MLRLLGRDADFLFPLIRWVTGAAQLFGSSAELEASSDFGQLNGEKDTADLGPESS